MMPSPQIREQQISEYLDKQLGVEESRKLESHLAECESCRAVCEEMRKVTRLFQEAECLEPSPFLWNRIASALEEERASASGRGATIIAYLRNFGWSHRAAVAALAVFLVAGIGLYRIDRSHVSDRAALAEIDQVYKNLAAQDPDAYNPFRSRSLRDLDANPFRSLRLSGRTDKALPATPRH